MLRGNIAATSLKMLLKNLYSVKCYHKLNMNGLTLSLWENFCWGLIYFDQFSYMNSREAKSLSVMCNIPYGFLYL